MYCIIVSVELHPGTRDRFLAAMHENAAASVRDEPGCVVFDVLEDRERADVFHLYEVYAGPEALEAHRQTPHYRACRLVINDLIERQTVTRCEVLALNPPGRPAGPA